MLVATCPIGLIADGRYHNACIAGTTEKKKISWAGIPDAREEDEDTPRRKTKKKKKKKKPKPMPAGDKSDEI